MKKHYKAVLIVIGAAFFIAYIASLQSQVSQAANKNAAYQEEIKTLSEIESQEAARINKDFLTAFFNYEDVKARNAEIKPFMTTEGYQVTQLEESSQEANISVSAAKIKSYERMTDKKTASFLTEIDLTISFDNQSNTETNYIKTELVYIQKQGWKIDNVSILGIMGATIHD